MTEAQKRFCNEFLIDLNATRAYKVAYPNCKKDETARANGLNPYKYMEYILEARPDGRMTDKELEALSPWNKNIKKLCEK